MAPLPVLAGLRGFTGSPCSYIRVMRCVSVRRMPSAGSLDMRLVLGSLSRDKSQKMCKTVCDGHSQSIARLSAAALACEVS